MNNHIHIITANAGECPVCNKPLFFDPQDRGAIPLYSECRDGCRSYSAVYHGMGDLVASISGEVFVFFDDSLETHDEYLKAILGVRKRIGMGLIGERALLTLYYEGSINTIHSEYKGTVTLEGKDIVFVADNGRRFHENTFDNYDMVGIRPLRREGEDAFKSSIEIRQEIMQEVDNISKQGAGMNNA